MQRKGRKRRRPWCLGVRWELCWLLPGWGYRSAALPVPVPIEGAAPGLCACALAVVGLGFECWVLPWGGLSQRVGILGRLPLALRQPLV